MVFTATTAGGLPAGAAIALGLHVDSDLVIRTVDALLCPPRHLVLQHRSLTMFYAQSCSRARQVLPAAA